jgi:EmrB/QacA subfamily drug resistance transporter
MQNENPSGIMLSLILVSAALATFMAALDGTIVNIALPTISDTFGLTSSAVSWVSTIYLLVMAGSLLIFGKISDVIGFKKLFLTGFATFALGSFLCGFLPDATGLFETLLIARVLQGIGGAMMTVIAPVMLSHFMPGEKRAKGMSLVILFGAVGMALGPTLGGFLTQYMSWNWIFFINVPVGIFAVILGYVVIPKTEGGHSSLKGFDTGGAILIFAGLAALLFAFSQGLVLGWTSLPVLAALILAVLGLAGFYLHERRAADPLLDFRLFRSRSFVCLNVIFALIFFTFAGANYLLPFYLEHVHGYSTSSAGLILTVLSVGMMITGTVSGQIYAKLIGKIRYLVMAGIVLIGIGFFLLSHLSPVTSLSVIILALALIGLGLGTTATPLTTLIMNAVPKAKQGMASSLTGLERFAPMTIGVAVYNIIFLYGIISTFMDSGILERPPDAVAAAILSAGFDLAFLVSVGLAALLFLLCFFIREEKAEE